MHSSYKDCHEKPGSNKKKTREREMEGSISYLRKSEREKKVKTQTDNLFLYDIYIYLKKNSVYDSSKKQQRILIFLTNEMRLEKILSKLILR